MSNVAKNFDLTTWASFELLLIIYNYFDCLTTIFNLCTAKLLDILAKPCRYWVQTDFFHDLINLEIKDTEIHFFRYQLSRCDLNYIYSGDVLWFYYMVYFNFIWKAIYLLLGFVELVTVSFTDVHVVYQFRTAILRTLRRLGLRDARGTRS